MRRVLGILAAAVLFAAAAPAQIVRPQKARLSLEPIAVENGEAHVAAVVEIEDGWHVQAHVPTFDYLIPTELRLDLPPGSGEPAIDYPAPVRYKFGFADDELDVYEGTLRIPVSFALSASAGPAVRVAATLRYQACDDRSCLPPVETTAAATVAVGTGPAVPAPEPTAVAAVAEPPAGRDAADAPSTAEPTAVPAGTATRSIAVVLLLALLGGLILNGMPCVLPILSLKVFGLVKASGESPAAVRTGALTTAAGILVSFWALAAAAILARSAGAAIGWGVQFQQPGFVAFLAVVVLLFMLNLWGLFEIPLPAGLARLADRGAGGEGLGGHFASGLFATLMATPCSAPFLGTALGFALGQPATTILATMTAVGVGLALPYLALALAPGIVRHLPRPGAWMDTLRGAMGFLLAGALVWLLYVLAAQVAPEELAFFELTLLGVGLALWLAHRTAPGGAGRAAGWLVGTVLAVAAIYLAASAPVAGARLTAATGSGIDWIRFDRQEAERLAASGRLVFLDITADWCVTCKVNERVVLEAPEVRAAFREHDVVMMKADWTNRDDDIAGFLAEHGRYGIPFYLLYRPGRPPHVFGELISKQGVLDVLAASAEPPAPPG